MVELFIVGLWILSAIIASAKNRSGFGVLLCGVIVTPILTLIYACAMPAKEKIILTEDERKQRDKSSSMAIGIIVMFGLLFAGIAIGLDYYG